MKDNLMKNLDVLINNDGACTSLDCEECPCTLFLKYYEILGLRVYPCHDRDATLLYATKLKNYLNSSPKQRFDNLFEG